MIVGWIIGVPSGPYPIGADSALANARELHPLKYFGTPGAFAPMTGSSGTLQISAAWLAAAKYRVSNPQTGRFMIAVYHEARERSLGFIQCQPVAHPNEAKLRDVATLARLGESDALCAALEEVLVPDFAPEVLLDRILSARHEIAHRCVTRAIDALPSGLPCMLEASKLSQSRTAKLVGAEDRIVSACKRSLVP